MFVLLILALPAAVVLVYVLWTFLVLYVRQARSPLRNLPGPPSPSFFLGHLRELHDQENTGLLARWEAEHGSTLIYRGFIGGQRLLTTDARAVAHILGHPDDFPKPDFVRATLASMAAGHEGLIVVEGEDHRRQRKILTPAFSSLHIKSLSPVFWRKAIELRDIFLDVISTSALSPSAHTTAPGDPLAPAPNSVPQRATSIFPNPFAGFTPGKKLPSRPLSPTNEGIRRRVNKPAKGNGVEHAPAPRVDVLSWLARATLDIIGEAGFGYHFNALSVARPNEQDSPDAAPTGTCEENELARAFGVIFNSARAFRVILVLQVWFPVLRRFARENAAMKAARATMRRIGLALIEERRTAAQEKEASLDGRDLLSVMIRSNLRSNPSQQLRTSEILCQISTFLAAGHETTASAITWTLYALARDPAVQNKLRREILAHELSTSSPTTPSADAINTILELPYLNAVIRESLRVHAPATSTMRVATRDVVIPLTRPVVDASGTKQTSVCMNKGDIVMVPLQAMNKKRSVWGPDAEVFRPERWEDRTKEQGASVGGEESEESLKGLWGGTLTFGSALGNRSCIGYRFALNEMKIFLYILLRDLEFSLDPDIVIEKRVNVVTRPSVKSEPEMGNQMPLRIRRLVHSSYPPPQSPSSPSLSPSSPSPSSLSPLSPTSPHQDPRYSEAESPTRTWT